MNNINLQLLLSIIVIGFKKYTKLYYLIVFSLFSIFLEITAMSLISSISNDKYIIFEDFLISIDKKILFSIVVALFVLRFVTMFIIENYQVFIARKFQTYLSTEALKKIYELPLREIESKEIGFYISMAGDESSRASELLNASLKIFNFSVLFVLYLVMIIYFDLYVAAIILLLFLLSYVFIKIVMKKSVAVGKISLQYGREASSIFLDCLNGIKTIKSFGIEDFVYSKYKVSMDNYQYSNYKLFLFALINRMLPVVVLFTLFEGYILLDYYTDNVLTSTYLLALFFILMRFLLNLGELLQVVSKVVGDLKATGNIAGFITSIVSKKTKQSNLLSIESIKFQNVNFGYTNTKEIFYNLTLDIQKNNSYAIVGTTGSGKSTLIDLMMDFLTPLSGKILINNIDSKQINNAVLKDKVIYISQESIIFNDTIKNNLCLNQEYSDEALYAALEMVELTQMINTFELGLNHVLYYKGTNISGGQKQRLNIARAILRSPDVLILDESVNALDETTRNKIVKNLLQQYKNKIIIFVTHDKDILSLIDNVVDLDKERIQEDI